MEFWKIILNFPVLNGFFLGSMLILQGVPNILCLEIYTGLWAEMILQVFG